MVKTKKVLSFLLTLCMLLSAVPMMAFADGDVAKIGDTEYATLADAIAAVPTTGVATTITMIDDESITVSGAAVTIPANKNIVLDLNGKTISGECTTGKASELICNYGTLIIKDSTDTLKNGSGTGAITYHADPAWNYSEADPGGYISDLIYNLGKGNLTVESGYFYNSSKGSAGYVIDNGYQCSGKVTVNGGKLETAKASAIRMFSNAGGVLEVNGGIIGSEATYMAVQVQLGNASVTLNDGEYFGYWSAWGGSGASGNSFTINGGTYHGYVASTGSLTNVTINGGYFDEWCDTYGSVKLFNGGFFAYKLDSDQIAHIVDGKGVIANTDEDTKDDYPYTINSVTCSIGNTNYVSLADAIAAVPATNSETTIKMLADVDYGTFSSGNIACATVPAGKNVILDLNGHTIKASKSDASANVYVIKNEGTLEIKDSGTNGAVIMDKDSSEWSDSTDGVAVENTGKFTLTSGTLEATRTGSGMVYALDNITGGTAVVNGGKIKSSYGGIRNYPQQANSDTSLTVNAGADISARHGICVQEGASKSTTVINGGTFVGEKTDIYVDDATASITVNGGYFKGGDYGELHDCTFCFADSAKGNTDKIMKVTGGYFTSNVISDGDPRYTYTSPSLGTLVPAGKAVAANEDEATKATYSYTIGKALVCENKADSNEKYSSVDDAINDALDNKETKTIKLTDYAVVTKDVLESGKNATNKVTVENNNNVLAIVDCNDNTSTDSEAIEEFIRNDTTTAADVTYNASVKKVEEKDIDSTKKSGVTGITSNKDLTWYSVEITKQESGETAKTVSDTVVIVPITYTYDMTNRCDLSVVRVHGDETTELTRVYTTENPQDGTYYVSGSGANTTITVYARLYSDYILASEERPSAFTNANYQASLTLNDGVALNLVINGVNTANYEADKLSVTVTGATGVGTPELKDSTITCKLADFAPAKFADSVTVTITYDSVVLAKFDYSVATYCAKVFTVYSSSDDTYKLCEALLNYGKFAADFVNGNTSSTLNSGHAITVSDISIDTQDGCVSSNSNGTTSLTIDSSNAKVALNFYIKTDKELSAASINDDAGTLRILNADGDRVATGDITVTKLSSGDYDYKVTINNMYVRQMSRAYTLQIDKQDIITSSVYKYCSDAQDQKGAEFTDTLKALCKCIYAYSNTAVNALV